MARTRFQVFYTPASKVLAAARKNGWTPESDESLLDAVGDHFAFEEYYGSPFTTLEAAIVCGQRIVIDGADLFGQVSVHEEEYRLIVPEDNYWEWETVTRHSIDETGLIESVREDA